MGKIKLARLLLNKNAVEEARTYLFDIETEENSKNEQIESEISEKDMNKKIVEYEALGSLYMVPVASKLNNDHLKKAMDYFERARSLKNDSIVSNLKLAKCLLIEYSNNKSKKTKMTNNLDKALKLLNQKQDIKIMTFPHLLTKVCILLNIFDFGAMIA